MSTNLIVVCFCALEHCLSDTSYVNYAVRDYIIANKEQFNKGELLSMAGIIEFKLSAQPIEKHQFWERFAETLKEIAKDAK